MSKSLNELFKSLASGSNKNIKQPEGQLKNPDVPDLDDKAILRDKFYLSYKIDSQPRNGAGYSMPRAPSLMDPKKEDFMLEGSIDPNTIRAKVDPDDALASRKGQFSYMPNAVKAPHNQNNLIKDARASYLNWSNRFQPQQNQPQQI
jgi:hypothetical protein